MALMFNENKKRSKRKSQEKKVILKARKDLRHKFLQQETNSSIVIERSEQGYPPMTTFFQQYVPTSYSYPLVVTDWRPCIIPSSMYTPPIQQIPIAIVSPLQIPAVPQYTFIAPESLPNTVLQNVPEPILYTPENSPLRQNTQFSQGSITDPVEFYLTLPKELFPTARMLAIDPNPLINEFCKMENLDENYAWILDLEFGIPRVPVTRAIPQYDVKLNSIQCKNTPRAIHPGFEGCSEEFKRILLFYYDCIISAWYRGYMILSCDKSVENFQSWLLLPMQILGMCWS